MDKQTRSLQAQVERLQAQIRPQELEATRLRADIENLQDEVKLVSANPLPPSPLAFVGISWVNSCVQGSISPFQM